MHDVLKNLIPFAVFGFPAAVTVAFRWFKHRERMARQGDPQHAPHTAVLEARLARMEQTLESVAAEVERVSEGQRFVTRLLAERPPAALPDLPAATRSRHHTPH